MRRMPGRVTFLGVALALVLSVALLACDQDEPGAAPTSTGSVETDREALVALYNATDGPNWRRGGGWLSDRPIGGWAGVNTDDTGRVVSLSLLSAGLSGSIPPELGSLENLFGLSLADNRLSGEIPPELGDLENLIALRLDRNQLSGEIPPELGNLSSLEVLDLSYNGLSGSIPGELGNLSALAGLNLRTNRLSGSIPPELGNLSNLGALQLQSNQLSGEIPAELSNLSSLTGLDLANNRLSGEIPPELGGLSSLTWLGLANNRLSGSIPPKLGNLSSLTGLGLEGNDLSGEIPQELWDMTGTNLWLRGNQDSWCVPEAQRAAIREHQALTDLPFCGATATPYPALTPGAIMDREALVALYNATDGDNWYRRYNWLSDLPLSTWEGVETDGEGRVVALRLYENNLTGEIPPELGSLSNLALLGLGDNWLSGEIPPELGNLTNLRIVHLPVYQLTGCIPGSLLSQLNIANSTLGGLPFCGDVPYPTPVQGTATPAPRATPAPTLGPRATATAAPEGTQTKISAETDREALIALYQATGGPNWKNSGNWLSSAEIGDWYGVTADADGLVIRLDLRSNRLEGELPSELGKLGHLRELTIRKNRLRGEIPHELGALSNLEVLDLYANELSGKIPAELGRLANLRKLILGYNRLRGEMPAELGSLSRLEELHIGVNELTGRIPPQLGDLANLRSLDLGVNWLEGDLPSELGKLGNLVTLDIVANELSGGVPPELGNLTRVEELKLDGNRLTGEIPPELGDLDRLLELGLSGNALSGCIPDTLRIHYYLTEELDSEFCTPTEVSAADDGRDKADFLGPNTEYIDPALVALLYDHAAGEATPATLRLAFGPQDVQGETALEGYIKRGGGTSDGDYIWLMPVGLVPSVVCRPDVAVAGLVDPDGTPSWESREKPYHNLNDVLSDVVAAHQGGMPENQAALYALFVWDNSVAVLIQIADAEAESSVLDWLAQRGIYVHSNASSSNELHHVGVLLPVGQILPLAQRFPDAYLEAEEIRGQGLPMLRSQWPPETLYLEKAVTQHLRSPDYDTGRIEPGGGITSCSSDTAGR